MARDPQPMKPQIQGHHSSLPSAELSLSFPWTVLPPEGPLWFPWCLAGCLAYADVQYFFVFVFDRMNKRVMVSPLLFVEVQSVSTLTSTHWPVGDLDIVLWPFLPSTSWFPIMEPQSLFLLQDPEPVTGGTPEETAVLGLGHLQQNHLPTSIVEMVLCQ